METTAKWHEGTETGNPMQSMMVNNMIKSVKRAETRGTGQASLADRAFTMDEFKQVLLVIPDQQYKAMMCFQYHLIARGNHTAHVKKASLNGIDGRLPAQQFNRTQQGRNRGCYF
jgi:hypothetical protein